MCVKTTAKRRSKSEAELLDHASKNLLEALKRDMLKKEGGIDYDKLRQRRLQRTFASEAGTSLKCLFQVHTIVDPVRALSPRTIYYYGWHAHWQNGSDFINMHSQ